MRKEDRAGAGPGRWATGVLGCRGPAHPGDDVLHTEWLWQQGAQPQNVVMSTVSGQFASI